MRSTARYIGVLQSASHLPDEKLLFSGIDLDSSSVDEEASFDYHTPVRIGYRQLPLERWVAAPLYKLSMQARASRIPQGHVRVTLGRNVQNADEEADEASLLTSELTREEFIVQDAENSSGAPVKRLMEMKLDTLASDTGDGYWLDTGILSIQ